MLQLLPFPKNVHKKNKNFWNEKFLKDFEEMLLDENRYREAVHVTNTSLKQTFLHLSLQVFPRTQFWKQRKLFQSSSRWNTLQTQFHAQALETI